VTERVPVYDAGMLIALVDRKAKAVHLHAGLDSTAHRAVVLGPVLAQVWRPDPSTVHALARVMKSCTVPQARSSAPALRPTSAGQSTCLKCATAPDLTEWHRVGSALGAADLPQKKRPDAVDALVALTAARHGSAVIFTSDPADLRAYLSVLNVRDVHTVQV
jgi:predicted nucleic acid-binding protein